MATTNNLRKGLNRKLWEFCAPAPTATAAARFIVSSRHYRQQQLYVVSATECWMYNPNEDAWISITSPALAGTFGAGACGTAGGWSTGSTVGASFLTATAGTTSTIVTNQTLAKDLRGYKIMILFGPNAGAVLQIESNTIGINATITVPTQGLAFDNTTRYRLLTPRFYILNAGTLALNIFKVYDFATNTWTTLTQTNLPATIGTDSRLIATPSILDGDFKSFATGTATGGGVATIDNAVKNWTINQWTNYQIRITAGTGAGQIRIITSNTATQITVSVNWDTPPDNTSVYSIEGNDDYLYYMGSNAVTLYRYSISANTWTPLVPGVARATAPGTGMSGQWIHGVTESDWTNENVILNGRRIYSFRGAGTSTLDYYDIPSNAWTNGITYSPNNETFTTGTKYAYVGNRLYIQKEATGRWLAYDIPRYEMVPFSNMIYTQGAAVLGDTSFDYTYEDGATEITWVYMLLNTSTVLLRCMII